MKFGIPISFLVHAAFLSGGIFFSRTPPLLPPERLIIPIDVISVTDTTNIRASVKRPEPKPEPVAEPTPEPIVEPEPAVIDTPPEAESVPEVAPAPEPAPPESEVVSEAESSEEAEDLELSDEAQEEAPSFNLDDLSVLVDRSRENRPEANQQKLLQSEETLYAFADVTRRGAGAGDGLSQSEVDALRAAMYKCWRIPADALNPESLIIPVEVKLHRDGHVASVQLKNPAVIHGSSNLFMPIAADNALRAVSKCAPYDFLPANRYDNWKQMTLTFRPVLSQ